MFIRAIDKANDAEFHSRLSVLRAQGFLQQILEDNGITQKELAARMGLKKSTVSRLLNSNRNLTIKSLAKVLHAIGMEPLWEARFIKGNKYAEETKRRQKMNILQFESSESSSSKEVDVSAANFKLAV